MSPLHIFTTPPNLLLILRGGTIDGNLMTAPKIQVYTTPYCPYCDAAKRLLNKKGLSFEEIDVSDFEEKQALKERTGWRTVPQIFINEKMIGGYQELLELEQKGLLK